MAQQLAAAGAHVVRTTWAPAAASCWAMASPRPRDAPVIMAGWAGRPRGGGLLSLGCCGGRGSAAGGAERGGEGTG
nr:hypothetical protein [Mycobacterium tuberculosis]